ncbi:hypothetical protein [Spartinivicinus poritis]|uniref:Zinc-ribbon domain-containing protein n=1 Tax=Spartinivicinus poritis TaxID=2994640 RepID=A0ABT5UKY9_9GAMM|nr:hypothetical protein [Spartinivicinus sp. A2-2]MDE1466048.1 hypothetical protein [Spartinivicinus sp. A2-2]
MNCTECGEKTTKQAKFCSECGHSLRDSGNVNINSGDNSVNFGQQNQVTGNTIHINTNEDSTDKAYIERTKIKPLSIGGTQLKDSWLVITGFLSFFGSIASILGFISTGYQFLFILTMGIGMIFIVLGLVLLKTKHFSFPPFFNLESGSKGEIYITKVEGSCPKCTGTLKLRSIGSKNNKATVIRCTRNPDHLWGFDPTVLPDL